VSDRLRPFFSYYGGKWRAAPRYPSPEHTLIVEPFAGSAGYATRHHDRHVLLVEADETIAALWKYLIRVPSYEIRSLPLDVESTDSLKVAEEARSIIGFWLNHGASSPRKRPSAWMRSGIRPGSFWGEEVRARIAWQVDQIRHWRLRHDTYAHVDGYRATWFVDPPYAKAGKHYRHSVVDFDHLSRWCRDRSGQVIVCENAGASWLPFESLGEVKSTSGYSHEVMWTNEVAA